MKKHTAKRIAFIGILAALVYVTSAFLQIPIPTAIGNTRLHFGNVMCLLSGLLLGPVSGGLAAGIGSMFFDLTNPAYITSAPFTFAFKFLMAFLCGILAHHAGKERTWKYILAALLGAALYVVLYLGKSFLESYLVMGIALDVVWVTIVQKGTVSIVNGIIAAVVSVPLYLALRAPLRKFQLLP